MDSRVLPGIALVAFALAGYTLLWCAAAAAVATLWQGAARSVAILVGAWLLASLVMPFAAAMTISMAAPSPSRAAYIDASREAMDAFYANESAIYASYVAARPDLRKASSPALVSNSAIKRFARDEAYKAPLRRWEERFEDHARRVEALASWLRMFSPALALDGVLQRVAGTDTAAYRRFGQRSQEHTKELREFFEPLALANAVKGEKRSCDACPGRMNFTTYDRVPTFVPDPPATALSTDSLANALWSWIVAAALALLAARRLAEWPA